MMMRDNLYPVIAGFLPLLDAAILIVAKEQGFAEREGVALHLVRESSWANIRDRIAVGHFNVAHMLAPMPIASRLGLTPMSLDLIAPMALGLGGNAITVSLPVWNQLREQRDESDLDPASTGGVLRNYIRQRKLFGESPLSLAVVHPYSGHNYELRYWLAACGIDPENDVEIVIVPPTLMPDALRSGRIDGFCVGEPWSTVAVQTGAGRIITSKAAIWRSSPEKVLGVSASWASANPELLASLLRALYHASQWCEQPHNHQALAQMLAQTNYLDVAAESLLPALTGQILVSADVMLNINDFFIPFSKAATFPWQSHALWFYSQMVRWNQVDHHPSYAQAALETYRPDLYRAALSSIGASLPGANAKVEGALTHAEPVGATGGVLSLGPDGFFDGRVFDPDRLEDYIAGQRLMF